MELEAWQQLRTAEGLNGWRADEEPELAEDDEFGRWLVTLKRTACDDWGYETAWVYGTDADDARLLALEQANA